MISQVVKIERVGRFVNFQKEGQQDFEDLTIVYAENGSGKTTLAEILRSLKKNDEAIIRAKHTLGATEEPRVHIRLDDERNAWFKEWSWTESLENVKIFDTTFVNDNIFSGDVVEHRQKKNLYRFVIGEEGVALVHQEEELDDTVSEKKGKISQLNTEIQKHITSSRDVNDFVALDADDEIERKIDEQEKRVERLKKAGEVARKDDLKTVQLPTLPLDALRDVLGRTLEHVSENAEEQLRQHVDACMDEHGEKWLKQGLAYVTEGNCPFCGESVQDLDLVAAYRSYFDDAYENLKREVRQARSRLKGLLSQDALVDVQQALSKNETLIEFWKDRADVEYDGFSFEKVRTAWNKVRQCLLNALSEKTSAPLEALALSQKAEAAVGSFNDIVAALERHNEAVKAINETITEAREEASGGDLKQAQKQLERLHDVELRQEERVDALCEQRAAEVAKKTKLERKKDAAKKASAEYTERIFDKHQSAINRHLENVGARFRITDIGTRHYGGKPSSRYQIEINDTAVKLGTDSTPRESPTFKTALSTGDKHTLAFAFFLARLENIDLEDQVVVFDDPVTSLDIHREGYTIEQIMNVMKRTKQVVVLSHNQHFLQRLESDSRNYSSPALLKIRRGRDGSIIQPWEIDHDTRISYQKDYEQLTIYLEHGPEGNLLGVVRSIRPLLEYFLRIRFPNDFGAPDGLGDYATAIQDAEPPSRLCAMKGYCDDLIALHEYTKPFMHGANTRAGSEDITDRELQGHVRRALRVIHGE